MVKLKDRIQKPNNETQKRNRRTERFHQIMFSNSGGGNGGGDPDENALNGNLSQHNARSRLEYGLQSYKKKRLRQPITPLNVRSRLHAILVLLYFQHGLYGSDTLDKVRGNRRAARQSGGMRRYEAASGIHQHRERDRERQERKRSRQAPFEEKMRRQAQDEAFRAGARSVQKKQQKEAHKSEQEDLDQTYAQAMETLWEKESRQEQAALKRQKDLDRQALTGTIVEVENESTFSPSREPAGDTLIEVESDLLTLVNEPTPSTQSLLDIAHRLEKEILDANSFHSDENWRDGENAPSSGSFSSLASDISNFEDNLPSWPGMTGESASSREWHLPDNNTVSAPVASDGWPFGAAAGYDLLPQQENGPNVGQGLSGLLWSAIKKFGPAVPGLTTLAWVWWPSSGNNAGEHSEDNEINEIVRRQVLHAHRLSQLPPATEEEWGTIEIDEATENDNESESTTENCMAASTSKPRRRRSVGSGPGASTAQEWGRLEDWPNIIRRVKGNYVLLDSLNQKLNIDGIPNVSVITVEAALLLLRRSLVRLTDERFVNFYYLLANGYTYKVLPHFFYDNGARKAQSIEFYKDNELKLTVNLRGAKEVIDKSVRDLPVIEKNLAALKAKVAQEQKPDGAAAKPPVNAVPRTGPGTIWRVTAKNTERSKEMTKHDDIAIFDEVPDSSSYSLNFPFLSQGLMTDTRDADISPLLNAGFIASYSIATANHISRAKITLSKDGVVKSEIDLKGDEKTVKRIIQTNQVRSALIENDSSIAQQSKSMNEQLSEENVLKQDKSSDAEKMIFHTSPHIRSNIQPLPYATPPKKTISITLDNANDNFTLPYGANGHWELVIPELEDESGSEKPGNGIVDTENIRDVSGIQSGLKLVDEGIDRQGESFVLFKSNNKNFSLKMISKNGNRRFNTTARHVLSKIADANQRSYESFKSDTDLFSDAFFIPNPSVNGTYKIENSNRPIKIVSSNAEEHFLINSFNHDAEISVSGAYQKSMRLVTVSDSLFMSELEFIEDSSKPYTARFRNHVNGKILTIRAENKLSNATARQLALSLRYSLGGNENEYARQMTKLSTIYATSAANQPEHRDWAIRRWNKISRPAQDRAVDFNNRRRVPSEFYVRRHYTPSSIVSPPFKILRDALIIEHDGTCPGEKGNIAWEGVTWEKASTRPRDSDSSLYRSHFKESDKKAATPTAWNWQAASFVDAVINNSRDSSIEFAVENDINKVKEYDASIKKKARDFEKLAEDIQSAYPMDAAALLLFVKWMTGENIEGLDFFPPPYAAHDVERSKLIFAAFSKVNAANLKTDHSARRRLIESLAYLLPDTVKFSTSDTPPKAPVTKAPATEAPVTKAPATKAPVPNTPAAKAPATNAPATNAPAAKAPATIPKVIYITNEDSSESDSDSGGVAAAALGIAGGFLVLVGALAAWLVKNAAPAIISAVGEFLGALGEGAVLLVVPTFQSAAGTAAAGMSSASAIANAINQLAESHPEIFPEIGEDAMSKIHIVELGGCSIMIVVEGARTKESIDEVMNDPSTKNALDALGNILVEAGTVAACAGVGANVAAENPKIYRYVSASTLFKRLKDQADNIGVLGSILTLFGGSISLRSSYMHDDDPADPDAVAPDVPAAVNPHVPAVPAAVDPAAANPPRVEKENPWWKKILLNLPWRGAR
ncbi:hypothetical protein [Herbaspirillum sp. RV1423]|uniref:hypothetical protein n=1 Tax=Herbaspirillum sp. RV1423 TaxID=1443993 RepID=UPI0004B774FE|nr:hypothetical protein [Herbaspirillum sp. RV1423]